MKIKLGGKLDSSIVNGDGIRSVLFFTGCTHLCKGCHNSHLIDYNSGEDFSIEEIMSILEKNEKITNKKVTFSGGDPFFQAKEISILAKELKKNGYNIWCYTGYTIEQILESNNEDFTSLLKHIDILVDGKFEEELKDKALKYTGSSNQRIINVHDYINSI